jgi:peptidyl-prolyl cis-trans isomerase C
METIMAKATARHILVETQKECENLKQQIENGLDFADGQGIRSGSF